MKINYNKILKKNIINVLKEILIIIEKDGLISGNHLYVTFNTEVKKLILPDWLKKKYPKEMTIVIQHEYWNLKVLKDSFEIFLSFNEKKTKLNIPFNSIISFADPYANFGLKINSEKRTKKIEKKIYSTSNVIDFKKYKKLN